MLGSLWKHLMPSDCERLIFINDSLVVLNVRPSWKTWERGSEMFMRGIVGMAEVAGTAKAWVVCSWNVSVADCELMLIWSREQCSCFRCGRVSQLPARINMPHNLMYPLSAEWLCFIGELYNISFGSMFLIPYILLTQVSYCTRETIECFDSSESRKKEFYWRTSTHNWARRNICICYAIYVLKKIMSFY